MECFINFLGVKGKCGVEETPESGLWLNDLPFINIEYLDAAISTTHQNAYDELVRKYEVAQIMVMNDLKKYLSGQFRFNNVIEHGTIGFYKDNLPAQVAQSNYVGLTVRVDEQPFLSFNLSRVGLQMQNDGDIDIVVIDLASGLVLDTITVEALADEIVYVEINKKYKTNSQRLNLFIGYDATGNDTYETTISKSAYNYSACNNSRWQTHGLISVQGASLPLSGSKVLENTTSITGTSGITIDYTLNCDIERFFCSVKHQFDLPILYKTGILVLDEVIGSNRFNSLIRLNGVKFEDARVAYTNYYADNIEHTLRNLFIPKDICFVCEPRVRTKVNLP